MSEIPDMRGIPPRLGVSEETVQRWQDEGLINAKPLPEGAKLRRVTPEDLDRMAAEGILYGPFPESAIEAALKATVEERP
jgi:DNA-binding transcriptional MerR regulator